VDGISLKSLNTTDTLKAIARKKEGETANLVFVRNGETKTASVVVVLRKNFLKNDPSWQQESKSPPGVSQLIFGGSAGVLAQLAESEQYPSDVFLNVYVASKDAAPFVADDTKFGSGSSLVQAHRSESPQATETLWNESSFQEVVS
jgi:hypothetical protein